MRREFRILHIPIRDISKLPYNNAFSGPGSTLFCIVFFLTLSHPRRVTLSMSSGCFALCTGNPSPLNMTPFYYFLNAKNRANELCQDVSILKSNFELLFGMFEIRPCDLFASIILQCNFIRRTVSWQSLSEITLSSLM